MRKDYFVWSICVLLVLATGAFAQSPDFAPPEVLQRTFAISIGNTLGTGFLIDYHEKLYFVTARHVVADLPSKNGTLKVLQAGEWKNYQVLHKLLPAADDVDIAVLETSEKHAQPYVVKMDTTMHHGGMGQNVFFLGFPYGMNTRFLESPDLKDFHLPFIKRGTLSAIGGTRDATILYVDGFNNPGFSGGPIVAWNYEERVYYIIGVVKGYREESAKTIVNGQHVDTELLVNSGILIGYSIKHVTEAIERGEQAQSHTH